jgi:hypothetical protein
MDGDGAAVSEERVKAARATLLASRRYSDSAIDEYVAHRKSEVIRDETGRVRGCSTIGCDRPAVWQRVFKKSPNPQRMIADVALAASVAVHPANGLAAWRMVGQSADFGGYRLGESRDAGMIAALQFGCWRHLADFLSIPSTGGRYFYEVMSATLPQQPPHSLFGISEDAWKFLKTAEEAQCLGEPEGPRGFCGNCGLPHCPYSTRGLTFGEGKEFWRTYCAYCGSEVKVEVDGV